MSNEEQPQEQRLLPKPASLQEAITAHHNMRYYLDWYKQAEREARTDLADFMCIQEDDYCGQTITSPDGSKIQLTVQKTMKVSSAGDRLQHVMSWVDKEGIGLTDAMLKDFRKEKIKREISFSRSGYDNLPDAVREYLAPNISEDVQLTIKYLPPKDDR